MRGTTIGMAAAAIATIAAATAVPTQAVTGHASITDVSGDANGVDGRFIGGPVPKDTEAGPVSVPALDITGANLVGDKVVVQLLTADPSMAQLVIVTLATPKCDHVQIEWQSSYDGIMVSGCHGTQRAYADGPRYSGNNLTFTLPSPLPRWLPAGTKVSRLDVQTQGYVDVVLGALTPPIDFASGSIDGTL